ncbi:MAG TPA: HAD family phosphatase [Gemmatimonadales bacterium]
MTRDQGALLFDFNGVLVDDEDHHCEALRAVLREQGIELTREQYYAEYLGFDDRMCFVDALRRAHRTPLAEQVSHLIAAKSQIYETLISRNLALVPGVREFVMRAAGGFRLAIVSGALRREIELVLEQSGLRRHFTVIVAAEDVSLCKPDPEGYLAAHAGLERAGPLTRRRCVVFEDSLPGLEAAQAAGMRCVALSTSHPAPALRVADLVWPSFQGHDPTELLPLLNS